MVLESAVKGCLTFGIFREGKVLYFSSEINVNGERTEGVGFVVKKRCLVELVLLLVAGSDENFEGIC